MKKKLRILFRETILIMIVLAESQYRKKYIKGD